MRAVALLLAAGLLVAGCGRDEPAATVDGIAVAAAAVDRDLADIASNDRFVKERAEAGVAFKGTAKGSYDSGIVAELLDRKISAVLVRREIGRRGLAVTPEALALAEATLREQVVAGNGDPLLDGFPPRYQRAQIRVQAESDVLQQDEQRRAGGDANGYAALLRRLRSQARVEVSERFGRWDTSDPERPRVVARGAGGPTSATAVR